MKIEDAIWCANCDEVFDGSICSERRACLFSQDSSRLVKTFPSPDCPACAKGPQHKIIDWIGILLQDKKEVST